MKKVFISIAVLNLILINNCTSIVESNDQVQNPPINILWSKTGLDSSWIYSMIFMDNGVFFAGTNYGLLFSTDNGTTWTKSNQNLFKTVTSFYKYSDGRVLAGTPGNGLFLCQSVHSIYLSFSDQSMLPGCRAWGKAACGGVGSIPRNRAVVVVWGRGPRAVPRFRLPVDSGLPVDRRPLS